MAPFVVAVLVAAGLSFPAPETDLSASTSARDDLARTEAHLRDLRLELLKRPRAPPDNAWVAAWLDVVAVTDQEWQRALFFLFERRRDDPDLGAALAFVEQQQEALFVVNATVLRQVLDAHGWPTIAEVGDARENTAWLVAQHADHDVASQRRSLTLLERALPQGGTTASHVAFLTDRVLVNEGKRQRYGTQTECHEGKLRPRALEAPARVDERRRKVGLEPLEEYLRDVPGKCGL